MRTDDKARMEGPGPQALAETMEHTCPEAYEMLPDSWQVFASRFYPDS